MAGFSLVGGAAAGEAIAQVFSPYPCRILFGFEWKIRFSCRGEDLQIYIYTLSVVLEPTANNSNPEEKHLERFRERTGPNPHLSRTFTLSTQRGCLPPLNRGSTRKLRRGKRAPATLLSRLRALPPNISRGARFGRRSRSRGHMHRSLRSKRAKPWYLMGTPGISSEEMGGESSKGVIEEERKS